MRKETGKIIKGIAGFYYVDLQDGTILECKARGIFRKDGSKPLVGDMVEAEVLDEEAKTGNVVSILPRRNELIRPASANVDQALVFFAAASPDPNFILLDRFLIMMEQKHLPCTICFNKADLIDPKEFEPIRKAYEQAGYPVLYTRMKVQDEEQSGVKALRSYLKGKTTILAGPSGVGKSTTVNRLQAHVMMETGEISEKIGRGKQTTRHAQLIPLEDPGTYIMDTPGFSSLDLFDLEETDLKDYYAEFHPYMGACRFNGCVHHMEPDCRVKQAVEAGEISRMRYEQYITNYLELKNRRKY
ncbi:MAG: ribosome small subunit-dependent GTPase A [Lachnospiraceae bacterium]|nr:ribosome small subunit-dependent GTPase A [Lachnospiraceae bacterium]